MAVSTTVSYTKSKDGVFTLTFSIPKELGNGAHSIHQRKYIDVVLSHDACMPILCDLLLNLELAVNNCPMTITINGTTLTIETRDNVKYMKIINETEGIECTTNGEFAGTLHEAYTFICQMLIDTPVYINSKKPKDVAHIKKCVNNIAQNYNYFDKAFKMAWF